VLRLDSAVRLAGLAVLVVLMTAAAAAAAPVRSDAIDPGMRVNGMLVVQGVARDADAELFGFVCDPVVTRPGRRARSCGRLPTVRRIFVGHGVWVVSRQRLEPVWRAYARRAELWIDGNPVRLDRFGHADRWLSNFPPADGRDALLREWSIVLVGAEGPHSIRYRGRLPQGVIDMTWTFAVGSR
jgi:hypothetical protein